MCVRVCVYVCKCVYVCVNVCVCLCVCVLRSTCVCFQLSTVERQVFDFLGYMWAPIIGNFFQIIAVIFGLFGACQHYRSFLILVSVWVMMIMITVVTLIERYNLRSFATASSCCKLLQMLHYIWSLSSALCHMPCAKGKLSYLWQSCCYIYFWYLFLRPKPLRSEGNHSNWVGEGVGAGWRVWGGGGGAVKSSRKCYIQKPENSGPHWESKLHSSKLGRRADLQTIALCRVYSSLVQHQWLKNNAGL